MSNLRLNREYERYYQITFLDDLHNYFPDILYSNRFINNPLVQYIQSQTESIFNLYSAARNRHQPTTHTIPPRLYRTSNIQSVTGREAGYLQTPATEQIRMTFNLNEILPDDETTQSLLNMLHGIVVPTRNFSDPVVVRATQQQIEHASQIIELINSNENCTICQEPLISNMDRVRRLTHCQHMFHNICINTWFNTNVRCPICRHDIRS